MPLLPSSAAGATGKPPAFAAEPFPQFLRGKLHSPSLPRRFRMLCKDMSGRPYGKTPKQPYGKFKGGQGTARQAEKNIRAKFAGRHTLEELSSLFQIFIADLQAQKVQYVDNGSFYFAPCAERGERMYLSNDDGELLEVMEISFKTREVQVTDAPQIARSFAKSQGR
jgi:hypothetical protein